MQTNQPYTYLIPAAMQDTLQPGMRVEVPFGARNVMGFVVALQETPSTTVDKLRPIARMLDLTPVLNTELLTLSSDLAHETFAFRISVLQTMLPNALKASYDRVLTLVDEVDEDVRERLFRGLDQITFHARDWSDADIAKFAQMRRMHQIEQSITVNNRAKVKTQLAYRFSDDIAMLEAAYADLPRTAKKKAVLLQFIWGI